MIILYKQNIIKQKHEIKTEKLIKFVCKIVKKNIQSLITILNTISKNISKNDLEKYNSVNLACNQQVDLVGLKQIQSIS